MVAIFNFFLSGFDSLATWLFSFLKEKKEQQKREELEIASKVSEKELEEIREEVKQITGKVSEI